VAGPTVKTTFTAVDKVSKQVSAIGKSLKTFSTVAKIATAVASGAAVKMAIDFSDMGDKIAKTSRRLGLGVEAYQELRYAAGQAGVSTETLDKSIGQLNKRLGEMQSGSGQLLSFLKATDRELLNQVRSATDADGAFSLMMTAIDKETNIARKSALINAAFGRSGLDLVTMAEGGAEGLAAMREEARKYGNIISAHAAGKSEEFNDSVDRLKQALSGLRILALGPLVEALQPLVQRMADFIAANRELIAQKVDSVISGIGNTVRLLGRLWQSGLLPAILAGVAEFKALTVAVAAYKAIAGLLAAAQLALNGVMLANPIGLIIAAVAALIGLIVLLIKNLDKVRELFSWIGDKARSVGGFFKGLLGGEATGGGMNPLTGPDALLSRNQGIIESRSETTSRQSVDINVAGLPQGSTVKEKGKAPSVSLNYAYAGSGMSRGF
jgi:uncharacterized protein YoxC